MSTDQYIEEGQLQEEPSSDPAIIDEGNGYHGQVTAQTLRHAPSTRSSRHKKHKKFLQVFRFWSIMGFTSTLMCTWAIVLATSSFAMINGGTTGLVWTYIATLIAMLFMVGSLAEISSMAPQTASVYSLVGDFAHHRAQRYLSYLVGWTNTMAWQTCTAALNIILAQLFQGLIKLWRSDYDPKSWHITLLTIGLVLVGTVLNTAGIKQLAMWELFASFLHFFGILVILVPLWVLTTKVTAHEVFYGFQDNGGWGNVGLACVVGQIGPLFALSRSDGGSHIGEKLKDSSRIIPHSMAVTYILSGLLGLLTVLTFAFSIPDMRMFLVEGLAPSASSTVLIFLAATGSRAVSTAMSITLILLIFSAGVSALATTARHIFAFARDDGLPFPNLWRKVACIGVKSEDTGLPFNAFVLALLPTMIAALVQLAYPVTLSCCISIFVASTLTGHAIVLACILFCRLLSRPLPAARWHLGSLSIPVNILALFYSLFALAVSQLPVSIVNLSPKTANWSPLVWFIVVIFASGMFAVHGRYVFKASGYPPASRSFTTLPSARAP